MALASPIRLREPLIRAVPKRLLVVGEKLSVSQRVGRMTREQEADLAALLDLIATGAEVPQRYYRASSERRSDPLLARHGVMHLHLGGPRSNVLVYLIQYDHAVLLIGIDTHFHLKAVPPGGSLPGFDIMRAERVLATAEADPEGQ